MLTRRMHQRKKEDAPAVLNKTVVFSRVRAFVSIFFLCVHVS